MTPPRQLFRVEWSAARRFDLPHDRKDEGRNFTSGQYAAQQVAMILAWPTHMELTGLWRTTSTRRMGTGLRWEPITPADLPRLDDVAASRYRALWEARASHPDAAVRAAAFTVIPDPDDGDHDDE